MFAALDRLTCKAHSKEREKQAARIIQKIATPFEFKTASGGAVSIFKPETVM